MKAVGIKTNVASIGNIPINPVRVKDLDGKIYSGYGVTYRQWLIGMIASGESTRLDIDRSTIVSTSIMTADAIIDLLDKEASDADKPNNIQE